METPMRWNGEENPKIFVGLFRRLVSGSYSTVNLNFGTVGKLFSRLTVWYWRIGG